MAPKKRRRGKVRQCESPHWTPLVNLLAGSFMWMYEVELDDGTRVHAYKHRWTRCYLHLSCDGQAVTYCNGRYIEEDEPYELLDRVLVGRDRD
jgi:hypothetical protein